MTPVQAPILPPILTVGYQGITQGTLLDALQAEGVGVVIDVRAIAASRRAGLSKTLLAASLAERGIDYAHLRDLGTPKAGRDAARRGDVATMRRIFGAHMQTDAAQEGLLQAIGLAVRAAAGRPACLLCYEHDAAGCHRLLVAQAIAARSGQPIVHLAPTARTEPPR